jgi:hypothetical protein
MIEVHSLGEKYAQPVPSVEYFVSRKNGPIESEFIYPDRLDFFHFDLWVENVKSVVNAAKKTGGMASSILGHTFRILNTLLNEKRHVLKTISDGTAKSFSATLFAAGIHEVQSQKDNRTVALCGSHDIDGDVLVARAKEAGIKPENIAVFTFDQHEDLSLSNSPAGAVRALALDHGFGAVTVIGIPKFQLTELSVPSEEIEETIFARMQKLGVVPRGFNAQSFSLAQCRAILRQTWEFMKIGDSSAESIFPEDPEGSLTASLSSYFTNKQKEELGDRVTFSGISNDKMMLERRMADLHSKGITNLLINIDLDVMDMVKYDLTVPVYSGFAMSFIAGTQPAKLLLQHKNPNMVVLQFFNLVAGDLVDRALSRQRGKTFVSVTANKLVAEGGMTIETLQRHIADIKEMAAKYGIEVGLAMPGASSNETNFCGSITELNPLSPDYAGKTAKMVAVMARMMHESAVSQSY